MKEKLPRQVFTPGFRQQAVETSTQYLNRRQTTIRPLVQTSY
jgi:hypothetical protein